MLSRLRHEDGFGLIELVIATFVLSVAVLALMGAYDSAFVSLHKAAQKSAAATLVSTQLELYRALPYASIGLDGTTFASTKASDSVYAADEATVNAAQSSPTDVTIASCGTSPQCAPVQTVTGSDHRAYKLETFIHDVVSTGTWKERVVTVIARDPSTSGTPILAQSTAGFDKGP